ncbi:MAG: hypothetical protein J6S96_00565 [Muribaculaceae bacterium]|nr:hypothetical protein [Muribaculaceae bacterium]
MVKRIYLIILFTFVTCAVLAQSPWPVEERDRDESVRKPVRRLHPERDREKAIKEYLKEQERLNGSAWSDEEEAKPNKPDRRKVVKRVAHQQSSTVDQAFLDELLSHDYSLGPVLPEYSAPEPYKWKDEPVEATESELMATIGKESHGGAMRYMPRGITMKPSENAFFLYFDERSYPESLRLRIQYCADDPLNFSRIDFVVDGFDYSYIPQNPKRGKLSAKLYWENVDNVVGQDDKDLIYALTHCQWAEMLLIGADGINHRKEFTEEQLANLRAMLQLYLLKGGQL